MDSHTQKSASERRAAKMQRLRKMCGFAKDSG
jgi:hypothetical protein